MKRILLGLLVCTIMVSCQKSALAPAVPTQRDEIWEDSSFHDINTWGGAVFCNPNEFEGIKIDTLNFNTLAEDSNKFGIHSGSTYFPPNSRIPTDVPNIYDRHFRKMGILLKTIYK